MSATHASTPRRASSSSSRSRSKRIGSTTTRIPTTEQGLGALRTLPVSGEPPRNWRGPYLRRVIPNDPWGRAYVYTAPGRENTETFDLYSLGRDGRPGGEGEDGDVTSWGGEVRQ